MSLVFLENESDPWLVEHESCERLYREITEQLNSRSFVSKVSEDYVALSASIRLRLKQYASELDQLKKKLSIAVSLTDEETERRHRLVENLESKNVLLKQRFNDRGNSRSADRSWLRGTWPIDDDDARQPLLTEDRELTIDELKERQARVLADQDKGLESLSQSISKNREIAQAISAEVDLHNDLLDTIGDRMDRTNSSIQRETNHVRVISSKDSTWGYWMIIIILFVAIVTVALIPGG